MYFIMDEFNNKLTDNQKIFLNKLKNYIDDEAEIKFYGSIKRFDYIPEKSDIDIAIFTDNENSIISKLINFLDITKSEIRKVVYKIDSKVVHGYKLKYEDIKNKISVEMAIFNFKYKYLIKKQHEHADNLPFYMICALFIVKHFYYTFNIIDDKVYGTLKQYIIHWSNERNFIIL